MDVQENFVQVAALICEPARAKMLWSLLDGKAYTASELAYSADISITSASNHLSKLLETDIVKVEVQGRHRYYTFSKSEVAYAVESIAQLAQPGKGATDANKKPTGIKFCRTCYDHLAGHVGVKIVETMEAKKFLKRTGKVYEITNNGWKWFSQFDIKQSDYKNLRRPLTRQCLDWSERRPHLAGQLGADLLKTMLQRKWFKQVRFSRELLLTTKGQQEINSSLGVVL